MTERRYQHLLPPTYKQEIQNYLKDDIPSFDVGGFVVGEEERVAILYGKSKGVVAGVPFFNAVFEAVECQVEWHMEEGARVNPQETESNKVHVATVRGKARNILLGERTALNIITRASGIATQAKEAVDNARAQGWNGHIAGTRKTTPGFRLIEKYSLLVAGASTHRQDLSQMVMLKDNHIWSAGSITKAVKQAKIAAGFSMKIEVECQSQDEAVEAAEAGADIVMLDNFEPDNLKTAAAELKLKYPNLVIEASGGITPATMHTFFSPNVDVISQGRLTQGYPCLDFSLKLQKPAK